MSAQEEGRISVRLHLQVSHHLELTHQPWGKNGIGRHKIWVWNAEGLGKHLDTMPFQVPPHLEILGFSGWDLINQQRRVKHTGVCLLECSVIFLKASTDVNPTGV